MTMQPVTKSASKALRAAEIFARLVAFVGLLVLGGYLFFLKTYPDNEVTTPIGFLVIIAAFFALFWGIDRDHGQNSS